MQHIYYLSIYILYTYIYNLHKMAIKYYLMDSARRKSCFSKYVSEMAKAFLFSKTTAVILRNKRLAASKMNTNNCRVHQVK